MQAFSWKLQILAIISQFLRNTVGKIDDLELRLMRFVTKAEAEMSLAKTRVIVLVWGMAIAPARGLDTSELILEVLGYTFRFVWGDMSRCINRAHLNGCQQIPSILDETRLEKTA